MNIENNSDTINQNTIINLQEELNEQITRKFTLNKKTYKNLVMIATNEFANITDNKINVANITSQMLEKIINEYFDDYIKNKFQ